MPFENWPPSLPQKPLSDLKDQAIDYAVCRGLTLQSVQHAPVALFPSPFPRRLFEQAVAMQPLWNELVDKIAQDHHFITKVFDKLSKVDTFQARLYEIYKKTKQSSVRFGVHRSDYMLHHQDLIQQVELNTISASFLSLSPLTGNLHRYLAKGGHYRNDLDQQTLDVIQDNLPVNESLSSLVDALNQAHQVYGNTSALVVMVVQAGERNIYDQRHIQHLLMERHGVGMLRLTLQQIHDDCQLADGILLSKQIPISVVYYRAGYGPNDYQTEDNWQARLKVEQSNAIKCPNVAYQLVGAKKVQQVLCEDGVLEQFITRQEAQHLRQCFTNIYSLDEDASGDRNLAMAMRDSINLVLKPQREGGGNNYYGEDVKGQLEKMSRQEISGYILMDKITPPPYKNVLLKQGALLETDCVCELGVYGFYLKKDDKVLLNQGNGHILRTKASTTNEGGVATGFAVLDSPLLF